jgi:hypothetical protein
VLCTADEEFYSKYVVMNADRAINPLDITRFGESLRIVQDNLDSKNFYAFNPAFDK